MTVTGVRELPRRPVTSSYEPLSGEGSRTRSPGHRRRALLRLAIASAAGLLLLTGCNSAGFDFSLFEPIVGQVADLVPTTASLSAAIGRGRPAPEPANREVLVPARATAQPQPAPSAFQIGNSGGDGVYIRRSIDPEEKLKVWRDGAPMVVVGPDRTLGKRTWKNVRDPDGNQGWVPAEFLVGARAAPDQAGACVPSNASTASTAPVTTPLEAAVSQVLVVVGTAGDGVFIRRTPVATDRLRAWPEGTRMVVVGPDRQSDGKTWKNVRDPAGNQGWVPAEFLRRAG